MSKTTSQQQTLNFYPGVRAEPKFLKDPTSFESISSGLSRFSTYMASTLPKRKPNIQGAYSQEFLQAQPYAGMHYPHHQPTPQASPNNMPWLTDNNIIGSGKSDAENGTDRVTFASFEKMETASGDNSTLIRRSCLLLGYPDGFQIWDVSNPDYIHEICSVRNDSFGSVSFMHVVANPGQDHDTQAVDAFKDVRPLLIIVSTNELDDAESGDVMSHHRRKESNPLHSSPPATTVHLYSLRTHKEVRHVLDIDPEDGDCRVCSIKSNATAIVLGCTLQHSSVLHVLSIRDLSPLSPPLTDVFHNPARGPIFTLGARLLAYATTAPVLNNEHVMGAAKGVGNTGFGVLQGDKDVKGTAKDIAKEVVSGVKSLGGYGYQALSHYFQSPENKGFTTTNTLRAMSPVSVRHEDWTVSPTPSGPSPAAAAAAAAKKAPPSGMIMIRDIDKLPLTCTRNLSASTIAHFRPHTHPLSCLAFNSAGTLLLSASNHGHTFHIFSVLFSHRPHGNVTHLYSLARGYTEAQVEDGQFSADSTWCAVSTARGTTHVFAINPYGGKPEIMGHVLGKVTNPPHRYWSNGRPPDTQQNISLGPAVRIKQRRCMSLEGQDDPSSTVDVGSYGSTHPNYSTQHQRARLTCSFLLPTNSPYLINATKTKKPTPTSLGSFRQQASLVLSSFGSSMSGNDTNASTGSAKPSSKPWTSPHDKLRDNRLFGFDEEESSAFDDEKLNPDEHWGHQDLYTFHPRGILTLHRCWTSLSVVHKRGQSRAIEKMDLVVKEEDVAEWQMARNSDWEQVMIPLEATNASATPTRHTKPWLAHAEINTYANLPDEPPLWTCSQFHFQTYNESDELLLEQKLRMAAGVPATQTVVIRRHVPEPYSSLIDRVNKTNIRSTNKDEENLEDALAELEENLSTAMHTVLPGPSSMGSFGTSPAGFKRLASGVGTGPQTHMASAVMTHPSPFTISFEDAHLIRMGTAPGPEDLLGQDAPQTHQDDLDSHYSTLLHHSALIQFDDDESVKKEEEETDQEGAIRLGESDDDQVFSPDGDNEVAYPSESIFQDV